MSYCLDCEFCKLCELEPPCIYCSSVGNGSIDMFKPVIAPKEEASVEVGIRAEVEMPPLGLRPRYVLLDHRASEIGAAIERYLTPEYIGRYEIPMEWVQEYNQIVRESKEVNKKNRSGENRNGKE